MTIDDIIKKCGGTKAIERASIERFDQGIDPKQPLTENAAYKWRYNGIPHARFSLVISLCRCSADDIYQANMKILQKKTMEAA